MSYVYDTATLNAYSYGRLGALAGTRTRTIYDSIPAERGKKYKIWFARPAGLIDRLWNIVYAGKKVAWRFKDFWNRAYSGRFNITKEPVLQADSIYMEGTGGASGQTFGVLALDRYWATGNPLMDKTGFLGLWERRGIEGVSYLKIADADGNDLVQEESYEMPGGTTGGEMPGGTTGGETTGGLLDSSGGGIGSLFGGMDTTTILIAAGVGLLGVLWFMKRKKKKESQ